MTVQAKRKVDRDLLALTVRLTLGSGFPSRLARYQPGVLLADPVKEPSALILRDVVDLAARKLD